MQKLYTFFFLQFLLLGTLQAQSKDFEDFVNAQYKGSTQKQFVINNQAVSFINTFPNPAENLIRINIDANFREVIIRAKTQELYKLKADNKIVDVSALPKGVYTVRIDTTNGIYFSKLYKR